MVNISEQEVGSLPLVPRNPLPFRQQHEGDPGDTTSDRQLLRDSGGPVTRVTLGPKWLNGPIIWVTSPTGARDVLGRKDDACDRTAVHREMRHLMGDNLARSPEYALVVAQTHPATTVHQAARPLVQRSHGGGRDHGRREVARQR